MSSDYTFNYKILLDKIYEQCGIYTICTKLYFVLLDKMQHKHHALNRKEYEQYTKTQHSSTNYTTAEVPDFELSLLEEYFKKAFNAHVLRLVYSNDS